jgi:hypothetical protein
MSTDEFWWLHFIGLTSGWSQSKDAVEFLVIYPHHIETFGFFEFDCRVGGL